ncbi:6841_t:CDS:2 [Acaulospora morrowiae]|uniref:6841_t:CDS:1 n=1 Tax=Acaulospora morrowiae TaxID=94023 RepID=A0A9N9E1G5_9GLOM|nr:6841_t:CDS:2 [Acaulospora morrowiae]
MHIIRGYDLTSGAAALVYCIVVRKLHGDEVDEFKPHNVVNTVIGKKWPALGFCSDAVAGLMAITPCWCPASVVIGLLGAI